ncbi:MAG TPA: GeoRSP system radical SAM/SPASM protein [Geobacteraceae bacterium]
MADTQLQAPLTINWTLNNSCNFQCRHCYSRADDGSELSADTLMQCFDKVAKVGVLAVNFGGGEPLLRRDLLDLASCASARGLRVSLNSNGYLLDDHTARSLKEAGVAKVGISIDSHRADIHDRFRGVKGSHQRAVAGLAALRNAGIRTSVSSVICRINHQSAEELIDFAQECGAEQLNLHNFKCSGLGLSNRDELDLSPAEWRQFYCQALVLKCRQPGLEISFDDPIIASLGVTSEKSLVKGSVCGKLSLAIKANGDITPCGFMPVVIGNIVTDDLHELWLSSPVLQRLRTKEPTGKCRSCTDYAECLGGCSARALALTGDVNSPDPHCWLP